MHKLHKILIGAHTSAAGGVQNALYEGKSIGATTIQLFTANQKQWKGRALTENDVEAWNKALDETGIESVMSHDSYLINLGAPDPEVLRKSREAFRDEILRCLLLDLTYMNFHPGSALKDGEQKCLDKIVESILGVQDLFDEHKKLRLLLETTAGQGSCVGCTFEQIEYIIKNVHGKVPIGVCIDTCHIFAAGYDIRTKQALDHTLQEFDRIIGLKHLYAMHLNDSQKGLGSRVDRHQDIGKGEIGIECFKAIMQDERLSHVPKYLETPGGPDSWKHEIQLLRSFVTK